MGKADQSCAPTPSEAKQDQGHALVRVKGETHCGGLGAKPLAEFEAEPQ